MLVMLMPHDTPPELSNFGRIARAGELAFEIRFSDTLRFAVPTPWFFAFTGLLVVLVLSLSSSFRRFLAAILERPRDVVSTIFCALILGITLLPPETRFITTGSSIVLILFLTTLALSMIGVGTGPMLRTDRVRAMLQGIVDRTQQGVQKLIFGPQPGRFVFVCVLIFFLTTNIVSLFVFEQMPHVQDSVAQLFHAKIFASGNLTAPAPAEPEFFEYLQMIMTDRWYSQYPPGHASLLAVALLAGVPWILNPLLGSLSILLLYVLARDLYGDETGRITVVLGLLSPFLVFMSSEFMNHTTALFFFLIFAVFIFRAVRSGRLTDGLIAGSALGWLTLTRPYSAAALCLPFLAYALVTLIQRKVFVARAAIGFTLSFLAFLGALFWFNLQTNGDPFVFGFQALWGERVNPGFGTVNAGQEHTVLRGLRQTISSLNGLNKYLFEWPVPSLILVAILFSVRGRGIREWLLLASAVSLAAAYFFYWFQDWCFGPRFLFEATGPLLVLSARGFVLFPEWIGTVLGDRDTRRVRSLSWVALILMAVIGAASNLPSHLRTYGTNYWGVDGKELRTLETTALKEGIVFVVPSRYGSVFAENDPFLRSGLIFARDLGKENIRLMNRFPHLPAYIILGDTLLPSSAQSAKSSLQNR